MTGSELVWFGVGGVVGWTLKMIWLAFDAPPFQPGAKSCSPTTDCEGFSCEYECDCSKGRPWNKAERRLLEEVRRFQNNYVGFQALTEVEVDALLAKLRN